MPEEIRPHRPVERMVQSPIEPARPDSTIESSFPSVDAPFISARDYRRQRDDHYDPVKKKKIPI